MHKNAKNKKYIKQEAEAEMHRKVCNDENLNLNFWHNTKIAEFKKSKQPALTVIYPTIMRRV